MTFLDFQDILLMPRFSNMTSRKDANVVDFYRAFRPGMRDIQWKQTPIIASNMDTVGTLNAAKVLAPYKVDTALHKYHQDEEYIEALEDPVLREHIWVTVGIKEKDFQRLKMLDEKIRLFKVCVDVANGHTQTFLDFCKKVRSAFPHIVLMAGNIGNPDMLESLAAAGVDIAKIGIGSGAMCLTRQVSGVGVPQFTLIQKCHEIQSTRNIPIMLCSDGGVTCPGDVVKALAAGADLVMIGSEFAAHEENSIDGREGQTEVYGMSSAVANEKYCDGLQGYKTSEGRYVIMQTRGSIKNTIEHYLGGLRSGMTYLGARTPRKIYSKANWIQVNRQLNDRYGTIRDERARW